MTNPTAVAYGHTLSGFANRWTSKTGGSFKVLLYNDMEFDLRLNPGATSTAVVKKFIAGPSDAMILEVRDSVPLPPAAPLPVTVPEVPPTKTTAADPTPTDVQPEPSKRKPVVPAPPQSPSPVVEAAGPA